MSDTATIIVDSIDEKSGEKDGRKWTKWSLKDANGQWYSTFDGSVIAPARALVGKKAEVEYEVKGQFKNLSAIREVSESAINGRAPDGSADWDVIGLRKTRCVLWEQILPVAMQAGVSGWTKAAEGKYDSAQLAGFVQRFGRTLRMIAEADIYLSDPVENDAEWIPFEPKKKPATDDIEI